MRAIPTITKNLLVINILAFLAMLIIKPTTGVDLNDVFGLHFFMAADFHPYQLVTYMFMHAGFAHILFNMFALWMFGCIVERALGARRFLIYYMVCGIGAGLLQEVAQYIWLYMDFNSQHPIGFFDSFIVMRQLAQQLNALTTVGASGAIYAVLLAFGMAFPDQRMFIFPFPVPIKAKWLITAYIVLEVVLAFSTPGDGVAHFAHLGGMLFGFLMIRYWRKHSHDYNMYGKTRGNRLFTKFKEKWSKRQRGGKTTVTGGYGDHYGKASDWDYNAQKRKDQEDIDRILDKIRRNGYDSLSREEKQKLFDQKGN